MIITGLLQSSQQPVQFIKVAQRELDKTVLEYDKVFREITIPIITASRHSRAGPVTIRHYETTIERQDAGAIHRLTPRRSCEDDRDGARTREQAHSQRLR